MRLLLLNSLLKKKQQEITLFMFKIVFFVLWGVIFKGGKYQNFVQVMRKMVGFRIRKKRPEKSYPV